MEILKAGGSGALSPILQTFPTYCLVGGGAVTVPDHATAYGYVIDGITSVMGKEYEEGEYFVAGPMARISQTGSSSICVRHGYVAQRSNGGFVEGRGRALTGLQGIQRTDLVVRHTPYDPGFYTVHIPRSTKVDQTRHSVPLFCTLIEGSVKITAPSQGTVLKPGDVFVLDAFEPHALTTGDTPVVYLAFKAVDCSDNISNR